ncbi:MULTISPECIES: cobaltochelatase subunit CobN [Pseudomonas syringae group]|uniref:Cobaltochelatase subunit CobN n=4 Tax=Pseudomonas syringae group TaxID=136849 RepID=A0AA40P7F9_9PSED|nr:MULTISPECIES: cobaltochelatase subunit CobN [Pseudomonas syringae group]KPX29371.1 Cobaltochelatase subunit CobN [Pseudomonas coronafaciens pv. garcae]KPZ05434.1 Cobaltochelatase subunit CobN [Pseudomonas tremae]KPZ25802.1 Cobaltochelatase subunit CobN [Pseudomonas coronafaciens pv. zizaniae]RMO00746.1 Cobaltochelatase subunit CobN [Pseudomonas coronafaciens pv. coronafaciens]RMO03051.1 Cobaltochelatase subunit CobN [Pseudomonas coronafaciens pv. zizaniae]
MHLLRTQPGGFVPDDSIADLGQTPAELVILCSGDSSLALLAEAARQLPEDYPSLRLANPMQVQNHASVDLYVDEVLRHAKVILISLHGGIGYWRYGVERLMELAERGVDVILVPGDDRPDPELSDLSTVPATERDRLWQFLRQGGLQNALDLYRCMASQWLGRDYPWAEPQPLPRTAVYHPQRATAGLHDWQAEWRADRPVVALLFYRSHLQAANTGFIDEFCTRLQAQGINPLPIAVASLKEPGCFVQVENWLDEAGVELILNTTGFAQSSPESPHLRPFRRDVPVIQAICAQDNEPAWEASEQGLGARDLAMHIALPELDGRIISRPISFKDLAWRSERSQSDVVCYRAQPDRMDFVAQLARRWIELARLPNADKRVALILANYPTRDGRIGNGVGLDTPAAALNILRAMQAEGYPLEQLPESGTALIQQLLGGVTNDLDSIDQRPCQQSMALDEYLAAFNELPQSNRDAVNARWGAPNADPMFRSGRMMIAGLRFGMTFIGIQPARGYQVDPSAVYHDPDLVPPHGYLAFYFWLRKAYGAHAVVHVGKHGNLEWLPGKGVGLSRTCWPDAVLGAMPNIYPFIVNDPGEGAQAKRRTQAVIIDHLMPPLTRAETYGPLRNLELLADEFYEAQLLDPRRARELQRDILELVRETRIDRELALDESTDSDADAAVWLPRLDTYLCDLKESQIRDGLHIFGQSPEGRLRTDTLLALLRIPRGDGRGAQSSLLRALSKAFGLEFDPLNCELAAPWTGARPPELLAVSTDPWRSAGDARERLELYAAAMIERVTQGEELHDLPVHEDLALIIDSLREVVAPRLDACGPGEMQGMLDALSGRFVPAGPSGAPSRGRLDVLPTGRNFFSVDVRNLPTTTAWRIGFQSANLLLERHLQDHGDHLRQLGLSVWGTATMRTGGDDIAQAMALMGVRPVWATGSQRVDDFEILPISLLDRPRVDVTLRVSGFFRDAFANLIKLFDAAVQAVAALDEPDDMNPLAARVREERESFVAQGLDEDEAARQAGWRIFGAKPGAYGAGVQGAIDGRLWQSREDLAEVYLNWGGYAYGAADEGTPARQRFAERLSKVQAVLQNQDNREHDLLDSNDYYQFQGGMLAASESLSGQKTASYHGDHSQPDLPKIRTLKEELNRVIRSRAANPKWIEGVKRHGYKGAFEMAATVDFLFAFDATTELIDDHQYALLADAYLLDPATREFIAQHNPDALRDMTERMLEAQQRGLWQEPGEYQQALEDLLLDIEES